MVIGVKCQKISFTIFYLRFRPSAGWLCCLRCSMPCSTSSTRKQRSMTSCKTQVRMLGGFIVNDLKFHVPRHIRHKCACLEVSSFTFWNFASRVKLNICASRPVHDEIPSERMDTSVSHPPVRVQTPGHSPIPFLHQLFKTAPSRSNCFIASLSLDYNECHVAFLKYPRLCWSKPSVNAIV